MEELVNPQLYRGSLVRKVLLKGILILLGFVIALIGLETVLRLLPVSDGVFRLPVNEENPIPRFKENRDFTYSSDWKFSIISRKHSNNHGFLNDNNYSREENTPLMAIIGDSYVEAVHIDNYLTMYGILSKKVANLGRVYSFGISRAPMSTYLAYAEYARNEFNPTSMVFVIVGNDFDQSHSEYETLPGYYYFFPDGSNKLVLKRVDYHKHFSRELIKKSALMRYMYFNLRLENIQKIMLFTSSSKKYCGDTSCEVSEERISNSKKVVDEFFHQLPLKTGLGTSGILFLVDGIRPNIYSDEGLEDVKGSYFDIMRNYFMLTAKNKGYEVIDMQPIFVNKNRADGSRFEFKTDGHWNALGHKLAADAIESSAVFSRTFNR
jgi:hypothetical protein